MNLPLSDRDSFIDSSLRLVNLDNKINKSAEVGPGRSFQLPSIEIHEVLALSILKFPLCKVSVFIEISKHVLCGSRGDLRKYVYDEGEVLMIDKTPPPKGKLRKKLRVFGVQTIVSAAKVNLGLVQDVRLLR